MNDLCLCLILFEVDHWLGPGSPTLATHNNGVGTYSQSVTHIRSLLNFYETLSNSVRKVELGLLFHFPSRFCSLA